MKRLKRLNSAGDTIIEVLIVLAILSFAFAISSATANRGLNKSRNAQEHSQALGIINSQIELLRTAVSKQTDTAIGAPFCMGSDSTVIKGFPSGYTVPPNGLNDDLTKYPAACTQNDLYHSSITYDSSGYYTFRVRWDGLGSLGPQQEIMTYRIHQLTPSAGGGFQLGPSPAQIQVTAKAITPANSGGAPTCNDAANANRGGTKILLHSASDNTEQTTGDDTSGALFQNLRDYNTYTASITGAPPGFQACPQNNPSAPIQAVPGAATPVTVNMKVLPTGRIINGASYTNCVKVQSEGNLAYDGCFKLGNSMYAYRKVRFTYSLGSPMPATGSGSLVINYNQFSSPFGTPPPGYGSFQLNVKFGSSGTSQSISLPVSSDTSSYTARTSNSLSVQIPAGATTMELDWFNNDAASDPNLQINSIRLFYK